MAGYRGYAMSNNAVEAYEKGEMPLSKWTKEAVMDTVRKAVKTEELTIKCDLELLRKVPAKALKDTALKKSSWHHTGSLYNKTDFYEINIDRLEVLTNEDIRQIIADAKVKISKEEKKEPADEVWKCSFLEWGGTRKHPTATEITETGTIIGNWFFCKDGTKKNINAKGFIKIKKIS